MPAQQPNDLPLSQLPLIAAMTRDILAHTEKQHRTFLDVADKPHVLDDALVQRAQRAFRTQLDDLGLYENQCQRWLKQSPTPAQRQQIETVQAQVARVRELTEAILALLTQIEAGTINKVLGKSDLEAGLDYLRRQQRGDET
jgi:hypothetical protein